VNQVVQGSPDALGPKWLTGNRHLPSGLVWSGEDTLCGGRGDPLPWWRRSLVVTPGFKSKSECIEHMCARIKLHTCVDSVVYTKTQCKSVKGVLKLYYMTECLQIVTKASTSSGKGRLHRQLTGGTLA
jgi:hypothetical protein